MSDIATLVPLAKPEVLSSASDASAPSAGQQRIDAQRTIIMSAPILPTLLRQALPTMTVLIAQTAVNVAEAFYVGLLGTDALAGVALVFPVFMLMAMTSNAPEVTALAGPPLAATE